MSRNVFISFRFSDGSKYKEELSKKFDRDDDTVDFSEDKDRSGMTEETIKKYLYEKLARSSVIIVLLTPKAVNHEKNYEGKYDDWMYDEIRYSLEDRENNRTKGIVAVYVPEAKNLVVKESTHRCEICQRDQKATSISWFDNLVRNNMMNVKDDYKKCKCSGLYDHDYDSYCSLVSYSYFIDHIDDYINVAISKKENVEHYKLVKDLNKKEGNSYE